LNLTKEKEMADFRKWLLVLAVIALVAVPASAQSCVLAPGNPTNIRDGGLTELTGDFELRCTGGTADITVNLQIFMQGATVSNRVRAGSTGTNPQCPYPGLGNCVTDALVLINDVTAFTGLEEGQQAPILGLLQPAIAGTDSPVNRNSILFPGIVIAAGTTETHLRVTNVRVVAPALSTLGLGLPTQVIESVSFLPQLTVQPSFEVVANVLPPMQFSANSCLSTSGSATVSFKQCQSENASLAASDSGNGIIHFNVKFTEGFPFAFKARGTPDQTTPGTSSQINLYESGLTLDTGSFTTSYADAGTMLRVNFRNVPQGVKVFVTQDTVALGTSTDFYPDGVNNVSGGGTAVSGTATCGATTYPLMRLNSDNSAIWEIASTGVPGLAREISFGVAIAFVSNTTAQLPALTGSTPMTVSGQLWPSSTVAQASTTAAIPRFRDVQYSAGNVSIGPCATTLLYPFTTNKGGFETGLAVINTSLDNYNSTSAPLSTPTQTGNCLVYFFDGTTSAPAPVDTGTIAPGAMYANTISGLASGAAFQGYVIAKCNFQFAHGYAYVTDASSSRLGAQGYLALVIPDTDNSREPVPFSTYSGYTVGEILSN
jgi:hypothetical protein